MVFDISEPLARRMKSFYRIHRYALFAYRKFIKHRHLRAVGHHTIVVRD